MKLDFGTRLPVNIFVKMYQETLMLINICLLLFLVMLGPVCGHNVLKL